MTEDRQELVEVHNQIYSLLVDEFESSIRKAANELLVGMEHGDAAGALSSAAVAALATVLTIAIYLSSDKPDKDGFAEIDLDALSAVYLHGVMRAQHAILSRSTAN